MHQQETQLSWSVTDNLCSLGRMLSKKRLRSVVQSIAHHGVSGVCFLHPHLGETCKAIGVDSAEINLLNRDADSRFENDSPEIFGAAKALREKFEAVLHSEKMSPHELSRATARFFFARNARPSACYVRVTLPSGYAIECAVDGLGERAEIIQR